MHKWLVTYKTRWCNSWYNIFWSKVKRVVCQRERGKYRTKTDILILKFTRTNHYSMKCILMYKTYKKRALFVIRIIYFKPFQNNYLRTKAFVWERGMHRVLVKTKISKGFINLILNFLYVGNISFKIFFYLSYVTSL